MEKKKIYIFVVNTIMPVGGMESYTAGMAKYLESQGWTVYVLTREPKTGKTLIPSLNKYLKIGGGCTFLTTPPYKYKVAQQEAMLKMMLQNLKIANPKDCEIIVESCSGPMVYWAELLAAKLGARHIFVASEEKYRVPIQRYEENLDFFYFKWKRNEIVGRVYNVKKLFGGYRDVEENVKPVPYYIAEQDAIQDVEYKKIDEIKKLDWNICHIGRPGKTYVKPALTGVSEFARLHKDKKINLIFVGETTSLRDFLKKTFQGLDNVTMTFCGVMVPIPRILFSKIDVVIGVAGCANFAARENVYTIVGNVDTPDKTAGVFGYDAHDTLVGKVQYTYLEALENVLVKKIYDADKHDLPKLPAAESHYEKIWEFLKNVDPEKKYFVEKLSRERIRNWTAIFPFGSIARGARIILFGATDVAKDYVQQIESQQTCKVEIGKDKIKKLKDQPYCQVVAIVDEHPEEFDGSVVGVGRLKITDYDAIVISTLPKDAQTAYNKILKLVPKMADRIIYHFKNISP